MGDLLVQPTFFSVIPRCSVDSFRVFELALELELARQREPVRGFEIARESEAVLFVVSQRRLPPPLPPPDRGFDRGAALAAVSAATIAAAVRRL
ncbi:hypothetical protein MTO96_043676 [Rhipicephalus appendiculatus]